MTGGARVVEVTTARALRALAHPVRMALLAQLRRHGPLTATAAAPLVGESPSSCSFHLRQLARYGLVEETGGGRGRERPWRATAELTSWPAVAESPEQAEALAALELRVLDRYVERLVSWVRRRRGEPPEWQEAGAFDDRLLYLTAAELSGLRAEIGALLDRYQPRTGDPSLRPAGARAVVVMDLAAPDDDG